MREAMGGSQLLIIIVTLIVVIMTVLAASIGYTKAFKARNAILNIVQKYGAYGKSAIEILNDGAEEEIDALLMEMGYKEKITTNFKCTKDDFENVESAESGANYDFCLYEVIEPKSGNRYYKVKTYMYFELPLFGRNDRFAIPIYGETYSFHKMIG